jgi:hypothetical protein
MTGGVVGVGAGVGVGLAEGVALTVGCAGVLEGAWASPVSGARSVSKVDAHPKAGTPADATTASTTGRRSRSRRGNCADHLVTKDLQGLPLLV